MGLVVMKFGGTSVADLNRIKNITRRVAAKKAQGHDVVVVASAMAGTTDSLIQFINSISESYSLREYDQLVSTGETVNVPLIAQTLITMGVPAKSFTGFQAGIFTDDTYSSARIKSIDPKYIRKSLDEGFVCVVAGFQGINKESGDITTLGRGGSDTTAVSLAAALDAKLCEIYTDVDGVYTADPKVVSTAKKLDRISHEEMLELASLGAKVLHSRCIEIGMNYNVDIMVMSSMEDKVGTLVTSKQEDGMEKMVVAGVTCDKNQARITIKGLSDEPGVASKLFNKLAENNINVDVIIQNQGTNNLADIGFTVPKTELKKSIDVCKRLISEIDSNVELSTDEHIAKVSIVGVGMKSNTGVAAMMFDTLSSNGINIIMISTSEIKVSCVIDEKFSELAVRVLHDAFIGFGEKIE